KDVLIATVRSIIQLLAVGYVLAFVFDTEKWLYMFLMVVLMIVAATHNAMRKGIAIKGIVWKLVVTFLAVEVLTQGILIGFGIKPATAPYLIPFSVILVGNSMFLSILFVNRFISEIDAHAYEVELIVSLAVTAKQAIHRQLITTIKASTIPAIDKQKTTGL